MLAKVLSSGLSKFNAAEPDTKEIRSTLVCGSTSPKAV